MYSDLTLVLRFDDCTPIWWLYSDLIIVLRFDDCQKSIDYFLVLLHNMHVLSFTVKKKYFSLTIVTQSYGNLNECASNCALSTNHKIDWIWNKRRKSNAAQSTNWANGPYGEEHWLLEERGWTEGLQMMKSKLFPIRLISSVDSASDY